MKILGLVLGLVGVFAIGIAASATMHLPLLTQPAVYERLKTFTEADQKRDMELTMRMETFKQAVIVSFHNQHITQEQGQEFGYKLAIAAFYSYEAYVLVIHGDRKAGDQRYKLANELVQALEDKLVALLKAKQI
jgi:hypothetical protein